MEFDRLIKKENYQDAHKLVIDIKKKYEKEFNLSTIPLAQQLLLKDENIVYRLKIEQEPIIKSLQLLANSLENTSSKSNLNEIKLFLESKNTEIQRFLDESVRFKLRQVKDSYNRARENLILKIAQLSSNAIKHIESGEIIESLEIFEMIVQNLDFDANYRVDE
jgi:hypothetical protein